MKGLIFIYVLTFGGAATALFNPYVGLLIYVSFAILRPNALWSLPDQNYSKIVAVAMLFGWLLRGLGNWNLGKAWPTTASLAAFYLWSILSACFAPNRTVAWDCIEELSKIVLPFLVGITLIDSVKKLKQLVWVIVLSEGYISYVFNTSYYSGYNLAQEGFGQIGRAILGIGLVCCAVMAFYLFLDSRTWWSKATAATCAALIGHSIFLTFSRGALLALIVSAFATFLIIRKRPLHYFIFAVLLLIGLRMAGNEVRERFSTTFANETQRDESAQSRIELWNNCLVLINEEPVVGIGPAHFKTASPRFGWGTAKEAHSLWLQIAAEVGLPGLAALVLFYGMTLWRLLPLLRPAPGTVHPWLQTTACMVWSSLPGFIVGAIFVTVQGFEIPYYVVLVGAGALRLQSLHPSQFGEEVRPGIVNAGTYG